jgi:hypothetical protein
MFKKNKRKKGKTAIRLCLKEYTTTWSDKIRILLWYKILLRGNWSKKKDITNKK